MASDEDPSPELRGDDKTAYAHTLSVRLTNNQYRRLRRFVAHEEDKVGRRITHQTVLEMALREFLDRHRSEA